LKGLRLSATGTPEMRWGDLLGMTPRRQTFAEFVQALQLGQSDCVAAPLAWIKSYGLVDVIKSVIEMPQGVITGAVPFLFNADAWGRISDRDKKVIARMLPGIVYDYIYQAYEEEDIAVRREVAEKMSFHPGDPLLQKRWAEYQGKEVSALIELAERRKLPEAKATATAMAEVFKKWHTVHLPKFKGNREAFVQLLEVEVFSKVTY
jgi:TRAP-type C4-dicarboxylate transport system substrate-binding protein